MIGPFRLFRGGASALNESAKQTEEFSPGWSEVTMKPLNQSAKPTGSRHTRRDSCPKPTKADSTTDKPTLFRLST